MLACTRDMPVCKSDLSTCGPGDWTRILSEWIQREFLAFLNAIEANVPAGFAVHLILDNYGTHKHRKVRAWQARHSRYHVHFTPTYASRLNQVERWFGIITQRAIRRGSFRRVRELVERIDQLVRYYNKAPPLFRWTAAADAIFEKPARLTKRISGTLD